MKLLPINKSDKFAIVDDEDFERLAKFCWYISGSDDRGFAVVRNMYGNRISMANTVFQQKGCLIDHKDRNPLNNQKSNLRFCSNTENCANRKKRSGGTSKYKGVSWSTSQNKWRAQVQKLKTYIHIGYFALEIEAAKAYDIQAEKLFGEFALLNFPHECVDVKQ